MCVCVSVCSLRDRADEMVREEKAVCVASLLLFEPWYESGVHVLMCCCLISQREVGPSLVVQEGIGIVPKMRNNVSFVIFLSDVRIFPTSATGNVWPFQRPLTRAFKRGHSRHLRYTENATYHCRLHPHNEIKKL